MSKPLDVDEMKKLAEEIIRREGDCGSICPSPGCWMCKIHNGESEFCRDLAKKVGAGDGFIGRVRVMKAILEDKVIWYDGRLCEVIDDD